MTLPTLRRFEDALSMTKAARGIIVKAAIESRQLLMKASACRHNTQMDLCDMEKLFRVKIILFSLIGFIGHLPFWP